MGRNRFETARKGWTLIVAGFGLLLFGSLIGLTDNSADLNRFVFMGDTAVETFLEKFVGLIGGVLVLAWGLVLWLPRAQDLSREIDRPQRRQPNPRRLELAIHRHDLAVNIARPIAAQEINHLGDLGLGAIPIEQDRLVIVGADLTT